MSAFDVLERQLRDSARRPPRWPRALWFVPALAAAVLALLVLRAPAPDDERPATRSAATWTPVLGDAHRGYASISRSSVPYDQLREFAVLRRAPTAADRSPAVRELLRYLSDGGWEGVRVDAVRLLARHGKLTTILVPVERLTGRRGAPFDVLCVMQTAVVRGNPPPGTPPAGSVSGAGSACGTLDDIHKHGYIGFTIPALGLVPDGVASVRLRVRGGGTVTAPVRNNVYALEDGVFPIQPPVWLDANGREISRR